MFKKWKNLFFYIKTIKKNIGKIRNHFILESQNKPYQIIDMNIDKVYRLYTVVNIKPENSENMRNYGYYYLDNEIKKFISELNTQLSKVGLMEYVGLSKADQISSNSIHIIVEYKYMKTTKIARNLLLLTLLLIIASFFIIF